MRVTDRVMVLGRDILRVAFGPWPMPAGVLFIAATMMFNYVVAGPYPGAGPPLTYQIELLPGSMLSAVSLVLPVWVSNRFLRSTGRGMTRTWYLTSIACGATLMGVTRVPILNTQGYDVPYSAQSVLGFAIRSAVLCLILFALAGVASARIRAQAQRAESALSQVRESQAALVETEERVRSTVSTFLHDRVQASLVALGMQLKYIARTSDPDTSRQLLSLMEEVERIRTDDVRNAARQLSPDLETVGLSSALRTLGATYAPAMEVQTTVDASLQDADGLTPAQGLALYRIAEQALLNAAIHGHASLVVVTVDGDDSTVILTVRDNGSGLPAGPPTRGTGSLVTDTWVGLHGGTWRLEPDPDGGTVLRAALPLVEQV